MLRKTIRPEFLNRIDETIVFTPLSKKDISEIVEIQFKQVLGRLSANNVNIEITKAAVNWLVNTGFDPLFGARPVKRILQKYVLNELSKRILSGDIQKEKSIIIDVENDELLFTN